ncbi:MAG: hypothetical protein ABJA57_00170 [Ginsengibacter sp.]
MQFSSLAIVLISSFIFKTSGFKHKRTLAPWWCHGGVKPEASSTSGRLRHGGEVGILSLSKDVFPTFVLHSIFVVSLTCTTYLYSAFLP